MSFANNTLEAHYCNNTVLLASMKMQTGTGSYREKVNCLTVNILLNNLNKCDKCLHFFQNIFSKSGNAMSHS